MADGGRCYYLEVAPSDSDPSLTGWGDYGTPVDGVTTYSAEPILSSQLLESIGKGRRDTQLIVVHMTGKGESDTAAQAASVPQGNQNDWFLPSIGELDELYKSGVISSPTSFYWSSSQYNPNNAWSLRFSDGLPGGSVTKGYLFSVRAIRAF